MLITELTCEQEFELRKIRQVIEKASEEEIKELLLTTSRLVMLKDNVIKSLIRELGV